MRKLSRGGLIHFTATQAAAAVLLSGAMLISCTKTSTNETEIEGTERFEGDKYIFEGVSRAGNLTAAEWQTYRFDREYIHQLVPPMVSVSFNHADPRQHHFVMLRLKLAGKTPDNSPQLFEQLEEMRAQHKARGFVAGTLASVDNSSTQSTQHYFSSLDIVNSDADIEVIATASTVEDIYYGYLDSAAWDEEGTPLGNMVWTDVYGPMPYTIMSATGDLSLTSLDGLEGDTYLFQDLVGSAATGGVANKDHGGAHRDSYLRGRNNRGPQFDAPVVTAPVDSVADECISVCLNRTWTGDCDYDLTGTPQAFKLPLAGCVSLKPQSTASYSFNQAQITTWADGGCNNDCGQIRVTLTDVGGGCNVDQTGSLYGDMKKFWQSVTLSNNDDTLCWDMTGANAMLFDPSCRQVQDQEELTMNIVLPWVHTNGSQGASLTSLTNNPQSGSPDFPCIKVTNSCLAEGTMIELAGGQSMAIEDIQSGALASNPYTNRGLTVMDTAKGTEDVPMVRVKDEAGRSLLLTAKHPLLTVDRGMVQAEDLKAGDRVMTKTGPSTLVSVTPEEFDGNVHNVKIGSEVEAQSLGVDQTVVYANGFVVGDGQIQAKYESIEMAEKKKVNVREHLPAHWMQDYKNSARRAADR